MIVITFRPTQAFAFSFQKMPKAKKEIFLDMIVNIVVQSFTPHATSYSTGLEATTGKMKITAEGVTPFNKLDTDRFIQEISNKLIALKIDQFFVVSEASYGVRPLDKVLSPSSFNELNFHESLQQIFEIDEKNIPTEYICPITGKIMGNPAYLTSNPKVFYEYSALIKWISENGTDPTTRDRISAPGILLNDSLKKRISSFLSDCVFNKDVKKYFTPTRDIGIGTDDSEVKVIAEEKAKVRRPSLFSHAQVTAVPAESESKVSPLFQMFEVCKLADDFTNLLGKSLRRASNAGLDKEIEIIFTACNPKNIIDLQSDDPLSKKTALHFALEKMNLNIVELLIKHGARADIPDAQGNTVLKILKASADLRLAKIAADLEKPKAEEASSLTCKRL